MLCPLLSDKSYCNYNSNYLYLALNPRAKLLNPLTKFSNFSSDNNNLPENVINSKEYDVHQFSTLKELTDKNSFSLFYLNICSVSRNT